MKVIFYAIYHSSNLACHTLHLLSIFLSKIKVMKSLSTTMVHRIQCDRVLGTLQGWQGVQTIPRVVTYDASLNELVLYPIAEVERLRVGTLYMGQVTLDQVSQ